MKRNIKKLLAMVMSLVMIFPLINPGMRVNADPTEIHGYIALRNVFSEDDVDGDAYIFNTMNFVSAPDVDYTGKSFGGMSFDSSTNTLTLNNVNYPNHTLEFDIMTSDDIAINVKLIGTNKLGQINSHPSLNIQGEGTLIVSNLINAAGSVAVGGKSNVTTNGMYVKNLHVGAEATLTVKQPNPAMNQGMSPDAPANTLIAFYYPESESTTGLVTYEGNVSEAIKWSTDKRPRSNPHQIPEKDTDTEYVHVEAAPNSAIQKSKTNGDIYILTYHEIGLTDNEEFEFTKLNYDSDNNAWVESAATGDTITNFDPDSETYIAGFKDDNFITYNTLDEASMAQFPATISQNSTLDLYLRRNAMMEKNVYVRNDEKYLQLHYSDFNPHFYNYADHDGHVCRIVKRNNGFSYLELEIAIPSFDDYNMEANNFEQSMIDDPDYIPDYYYYAYVVNNSLVFSPKTQTQNPANTQEPPKTTMPATAQEPPKTTMPATVQTSVNGNDYVITTSADGSETAEYKAPVNSKTEKVVIDSSINYNGKQIPVTSIAANAYSGNKNITSLKIKNGISKIGSGAFSNCSKLASITIPKSIKTIGANAFKNCKKLSNVTITGGVTKIEKNAFKNANMKKVTFKSKKVKVAKNAFSGNKNAKAILPKGIKGKEKTKFINMLVKAGFKKKNIKKK